MNVLSINKIIQGDSLEILKTLPDCIEIAERRIRPTKSLMF